MYQFHKNGTLGLIFAKKKSQDGSQNTRESRSQEDNVKPDIYNYCARFNCVPTFSHQLVQGYGNRYIEVKIELPRQDIRGIGKGSGYRLAEARAALHFKQEAEKYHAKQGQSSIVLKDSTSLTVVNSQNFLEFYKLTFPGSQVQLNFTESLDKIHFANTRHRCQLSINGEPVGEAVESFNKKSAEPLAYLTAAVALTNRYPALFPKFTEALKAGNGHIVKPVAPINMPVDEMSIIEMRQTLVTARRAGLPDQSEEPASEQADLQTARFLHHSHLNPKQTEIRNQRMLKHYGAYLQDPRLDKLRRTRSELPMSQYSAKVLDLIKNSTYSIIVGATGSGKTTQVPQIILEDAVSKGEGSACNIICTQPRRIAATSVAIRVSEERGEALQETVGYQIRFRSRLPRARGSITFCTTGILLKQLQNSPDEIMEGVSHLIIDEVHERDIGVDFLLVVLKKIMQERAAAGRSTPKVVLMSATMNTEMFAAYFSETTAEGGKVDCPALDVPGRSFPVKEIFLADIISELRRAHGEARVPVIEEDKASTDYLRVNSSFVSDQQKTQGIATGNTAKEEELIIDWDQEKRYSRGGELVDFSAEKDDSLVPHGLVAATVAHIMSQSNEGAVLVFLPGLEDISKVDEILKERPIFGVNFNDQSKCRLHLLHSSIDEAQNEVFTPVPPGCRKIILSTNIAETSITIPDVQYVVDTGKMKEKQYDQTRRITALKCTWISKSNSKQRAGRAGRVQNGHYYALFPRERYDSMRPVGVPEILRTDLQEICLAVKAQAFRSPVREFLAAAIEPPSPEAVDSTLRELEALDAITPEEEITSLGRLLASLPVHPSLGKMIVMGVIFRCLDPMVVLGATHAERPIHVRPLDMRLKADKARVSFTEDSASDHIGILNAVRAMREESVNSPNSQMSFAMENFISIRTFRAIESTARQIEEILVNAGIIQASPSSYFRVRQIGGPALNEFSSSVPLIKALAFAGLHPNLAVGKGYRSYRTLGEQIAVPSMSSVNRIKQSDRGDISTLGKLLSFSSMVRSQDDDSVKLVTTTRTTPMMALLFGGKIHSYRNIIEMDGWLRFRVESADRTAPKTIVEFRKALERFLSTIFRKLTTKENQSMMKLVTSADEAMRQTFVQAIVEILKQEDLNEDPNRLTDHSYWLQQLSRPSHNDEMQELWNSLGVRPTGSAQKSQTNSQ